MEEKTEKTKKTDSRKFVVWLTWLIISLFVIIFCSVVMFITKSLAENLSSLIEKVLSWFFSISMMYLGMNVGQKLGFAFAEKIPTNKDSENDESNIN